MLYKLIVESLIISLENVIIWVLCILLLVSRSFSDWSVTR